jgi:nicotinate-nucleotide adenylyltransferase
MKIGVFGGTFDPPHTGHLILAAEAMEQLKLERVLWVLTPIPPHKPGDSLTSSQVRLEMLLAAIAGNPGFELSRVDIDRPPPYYAVDTVHLLRKAFPQASLAYLIGGDSLHDLPTWVRPQELLAACDALGVMRRPGDRIDLCALDRRLPGLAEKTRLLEAPLIEISSSQIRQRAASGGAFRYFVPPGVYQMIIDRHLYQEKKLPRIVRMDG